MFYFYITISLISYNFLFTSLRSKFLYFVLILFVYSILGFLYNLDGMVLIFMTTEFTVLLFFIMVYTQTYSNYKFITTKYYFLPFFIVLTFSCYKVNLYTVSLEHPNYYKIINQIVSADFYVLYFLLFNKIFIITIFLVLIISLFSLFFILFYFNLKLLKHKINKQKKSLYLLRKQILSKQTSFNNSLYTFQN